MSSFWIRLAEMPMCLSARYAYMEKFCIDYRIVPSASDRVCFAAWQKRNGQAENLPISVSEAEILAEQAPGEQHSLPYLETLAFYRKICRELLSEQVLLFHASSFSLDGKGYLATAPSGTGKSTHARLWREYFGDRVAMINDDKPLIRFRGRKTEQNKPFVYGTPYCGKENIQKNIGAPICGILVLHQALKNRIERLSPRDAFPLLWQQTFCEKLDGAAVVETMDLVQHLCELPVFSLGCTVSEEAVRMAAQALDIDHTAGGETDEPQNGR